MKDLTRFINEQLKPRLYDHIPQIFPEHGFRRSGAKWVSGLHADGSEGSGKKSDRSVVTEKQPTRVFDNTRQTATDVIDLYMQLNGIAEVWEAVNRLCDIVGIARPEYTEEAKRRYKAAEERRNLLEASAKRQRDALLDPAEGKPVFDYLLSRGWTEEDIRAAGELGYVSPSEARTLGAQGSVGESYTLSIALYSGSTLYGFKFRRIGGGEGDKYLYLTGTNKKENLFNLTPLQQSDGAMVVVEGELDAIHAKARGFRGFVATGGGAISPELLTLAAERGIKHITLLFDADKAGEKYVQDSIKAAHAKRMDVLVAVFPEESLIDGRNVKDVDDYLRIHPEEELQALIDGAKLGSLYLLERMILSATEGGELTQTKEADLRKDVIRLANNTPNEVERDMVFNTYAAALSIDKKEAFSAEALRAVADEERAAYEALSRKKDTAKAIADAKRLSDEGDTEGALSLMAETASELRRREGRAKYAKLLALPSEELLLQRLRNKPDDVPTLYELSNGRDRELFSLPVGAITMVCAPTNHGKSTFLQNLALQVAKGKGTGSVLYFSFEEEADSIVVNMLNKYTDEELCRNYSATESNNLRALKHYFKTGEEKYIKQEVKDAFHKKRDEFFRDYYATGKIRIYYEDYDLQELVEAIRTIVTQTKVKAVFVDYIQLLSNRTKRKLQRNEEIKSICIDLKNLAIETQLPIVVAAQLNREACSPLELHAQRIADAADIERIANKILCLWNSSFTAQKSKDYAKDLEKLEEKTGIKFGEGGKIYAKLVKNRGGVVGLEAVLDLNGNTGVIKGNHTETEPTQERLPLDTEEESVF